MFASAKSIGDYLRREKATCFMLVFVIFVLALSYASRVSAPADSEDPASEMRRIQTTAELKEVGEAMVARLQEDEGAMLAFSLTFTLILALGLFLDTLFLILFRERYLSSLRRPMSSGVLWVLADVFKACVFLFFCEAVLSFAFALLMGVFRYEPANERAVFMFTTFLRNILVALYVFYLVRRRYQVSLRELGLRFGHLVRNVSLGIVTYIGFFPIYFLLLLSIMGVLKLIGYEPPVQTVVQMVYEEENIKILFFFALFIGVVGPFFEEIFFRGFIYQAFQRRWGLAKGMIACSILFALLHAHWVAFLPIFALSVVLCLLFENTRSVIPGTILHMFHNGVALIIMFQVKAF